LKGLTHTQLKVKSDALNVVEVLKEAVASIASQSTQAHSACSDFSTHPRSLGFVIRV